MSRFRLHSLRSVFLCLLAVLCVLPLAGADQSMDDLRGPHPTDGPWLVHEDGYFRFVYKAADRPFLEELLAVSKESYEIVSGYFKALPRRAPTVILYGTQDSPDYGGFAGPLPMRIGLVAPFSQTQSAKTLLVHEFTHYLQAERGDSGYLGMALRPFSPDAANFLGNTLSEVSLEGTTSFLDGHRRSEFSLLPVRAAVMEGRMWNRQAVSSGGYHYPGALRVYFSGLLFQDWVFDRLGVDGYHNILERKNSYMVPLEEKVVRDYTGLDLTTIWGEVCAGLEERWHDMRPLPRGRVITPRDSIVQYRWGSLLPTDRGLFHYRSDALRGTIPGFWRPDEEAPKPLNPMSGTKEQPHGVLAPNPGRFVPLRGILPDELALDRAAKTAVAIVNQGTNSLLSHAPNRNELILGGLDWRRDEQVVFFPLRSLGYRGWTAPALSPDGTRLWAVLRESDTGRAVEVDMKSGDVRALAIPPALHIVSLYPSPDGKRLAVSFARNGRFDVGVYELDADAFHPLTDDDAADRHARFLADGRLVFSSDREDSVFVYAWDGKVLSRLIVDRIGAWSPLEDGKGGFWYASMSSDGPLICHADADSPVLAAVNEPLSLEEFSQLNPSWVARRDSIWAEYGARGREYLASLSREVPWADSPNPVVDERHASDFFDLALPNVWLPSVFYGYEGFRLGMEIAATSFLGTNAWNALFQYLPTPSQLVGQINLIFNLPVGSLDASYAQDYSGTVLDNSTEHWQAARDASLGFSLPLVYRRLLNGTRASLIARGSAVWSQTVTSTSSFNLEEAFTLPADTDVRFLGSLTGGFFAPQAPVDYYGASSLSLSLVGVGELPEGAPPLSPGALARLNGGLALAPGMVLSADARAAWRALGGAYAFLSRFKPAWNLETTAPIRLEAGVSLSFANILQESTSPFTSTEIGGFKCEMRSFWESDGQSYPLWQEAFELRASFGTRFTFFYNPVDIDFGLALNLSMNKEPGEEDVSIFMGVNGDIQAFADIFAPHLRARP